MIMSLYENVATDADVAVLDVVWVSFTNIWVLIYSHLRNIMQMYNPLLFYLHEKSIFLKKKKSQNINKVACQT